MNNSWLANSVNYIVNLLQCYKYFIFWGTNIHLGKQFTDVILGLKPNFKSQGGQIS